MGQPTLPLAWSFELWDSANGFDGEGPPMKLASANCTSWNSIIDVLETYMLDNPPLITIQEHKLSCCHKIKQATKKAKEWVHCFSPAMPFNQKGG